MFSYSFSGSFVTKKLESFRFNNDFASFPKRESLTAYVLNPKMAYIIT